MNFFKKYYKLNLLLIIFSFVIISCTSDDDDIDDPLVEKVTYTKHVKTIIDGNCLGCHGSTLANGAPVHLTNFTEVKAVGSKVNSRVASGDMPRGGGSLSAAQKKTIADWAKGGFLEK